MLTVLLLAVVLSMCSCAPLARTNSTKTPLQNDHALCIKIYSSFEISQSDISVLQMRLDDYLAQDDLETILLVSVGNPFQSVYVKYSDSEDGRAKPPGSLYMVEYITTEKIDDKFQTIIVTTQNIIAAFMRKQGSDSLVGRYTVTGEVTFNLPGDEDKEVK